MFANARLEAIQQLRIEYSFANELLDTIDELPDLESIIWKPANASQLNLGLRSNPVWLRITVNTQEIGGNWILSIRNPNLDSIELYHMGPGDGLLAKFSGGDQLRFKSRHVNHRYFAFPLKLEPGIDHRIYIKIVSSRTVRVPVRLESKAQFLAHSHRENLLAGFLLGLPLVLIIQNIFLFFRLRETYLLDFVVYIGALSLLTLAINGMGYQYIWSGNPWFQSVAIQFFACLALFAITRFAHGFLHLGDLVPEIDKLLKVLGLGTILLLGLFIVSQVNGLLLVAIFSAICTLICVVITSVRIRNDATPSKALLISLVPMAVSASLILYFQFGASFPEYLAENLVQIGLSLQIAILFFAISHIYRDRRKQSMLLNQGLSERLHEEKEASLISASLTVIPEHLPFADCRFFKNEGQTFAKVWHGIFADQKKSRLIFFLGQSLSEDHEVSSSLLLGAVAGTAQMICDELISQGAYSLDGLLTDLQSHLQTVGIAAEMSLIAVLVDFEKMKLFTYNSRHFPICLVGRELACHKPAQEGWLKQQGFSSMIETRSFNEGDRVLLVSSETFHDLSLWQIEKVDKLLSQNAELNGNQIHQLLNSLSQRPIQVMEICLKSKSYI